MLHKKYMMLLLKDFLISGFSFIISSDFRRNLLIRRWTNFYLGLLADVLCWLYIYTYKGFPLNAFSFNVLT